MDSNYAVLLLQSLYLAHLVVTGMSSVRLIACVINLSTAEDVMQVSNLGRKLVSFDLLLLRVLAVKQKSKSHYFEVMQPAELL